MWHKDLKAGQKVEQEFITELKSQGRRVTLNTGMTLKEKQKFDVKEEITYEIKLDRLWKETGNVCLEVKSIKGSEADFLIYKLKGTKKFYRIPMGMARELIRSKKFRHLMGGDQVDNEIVLIPLGVFKELFHEI